MKTKALKAFSFLTMSTSLFGNVGEVRSAITVINESIPDPAISALDLEAIIVKVKKEKGWDMQTVLVHCLFYKQFLFLCKTHPKTSIVPSESLDEFWHTYIMDTAKYAADCDAVFGSFLHHFPYFGMRGPEDAENLNEAAANTNEILLDVFGIKGWGFNKGATAALCGPANCKGVCERDPDAKVSQPRPALEAAFA